MGKAQFTQKEANELKKFAKIGVTAIVDNTSLK